MGQYFLIVNVDKREYIDGHRLGVGIKLWELAANGCWKSVNFSVPKIK